MQPHYPHPNSYSHHNSFSDADLDTNPNPNQNYHPNSYPDHFTNSYKLYLLGVVRSFMENRTLLRCFYTNLLLGNLD